MSKQTVNLDTYNLSLLTAKEDILNPRSSTNWALFTYEGVSNKLKLADSGAGGVVELAGKFHISKPQYGLCKVTSAEGGAPGIAMIVWVGEKVDDHRRTECASHLPAVKHFFKEVHAFITAEKVEDVTEEQLKAEFSKVQAHAPSQWVRRSPRSANKEEVVGTNYRKTNAAMEMRLINRDSFWARAEREEEERKEEEKRRATEEKRRLERERILKERRDAEERDRKMNEKLQMIEEQRRKQAEQEEELRKKEKLRWEQQQREHEDDMRARLRRSESIEKAAEAAALVSQRSMNPREFFRQLSSSSSLSPTSPGSSRSGKPFRRYQRSLTDTAFIFSKAEESASSSPRNSPLVSPFSRAPPSPIYRTMSPSPDFCAVNSPQMPRLPMSPPTSPLRPAPPVSALSSVPQSNDRFQAVAQPKSALPTEPSAPPASPSLLASLSLCLINSNPDQLKSEATLFPNVPTQKEGSTLILESTQVPTAPLPESPRPNTDLNTADYEETELVSVTGQKVQAVLVEEDEEEDGKEHKEDKTEMQLEINAVTIEPAQAEAEGVEEEERKEGVRNDEKEDREKVNEEEEEEEEEEEVEGSHQEIEPASFEEQAEIAQEENEDEDAEENNQSGDTQPFLEHAEISEKVEKSAITDAEPVHQHIKEETVVVSSNGIPNGEATEDINGTARSFSPSDTEGSTPEFTVCYSQPATTEEEDIIEDREQDILENGQEDSAVQHMCVRALYDYQAEDESEISFEPGDIIRDVETVDKAWWRGWSKDGRQGLFPANYVETI